MRIRIIDSIIIILISMISVYIQLGRAVFRITDPLDFGLIVAVLTIIIISGKKGRIMIPNLAYGMLVWGIVMFFIAMYISPKIVGHQPKLLRVGYEAVCLLCMIIYMTMAYSVTTVNKEKLLIRSISYFCFFNACLSVVSELTKYAPFMKRFYLSGAGIRFQGFAENPNDYMVQVLVAVVYFYYSKSERSIFRLISIMVLLFSAIAAGSKGGLFAIAIFFVVAYYGRFIERIRGDGQKKMLRFFFPIVIIIVLLFIVLFRQQIANILGLLNVQGVDRIIELLKNPLEELNGGGSDRIITWGSALKIFRLSPYIGVGIGGHKEILKFLNSEFYYATPHSIYFELMEQCGIIGVITIALCVIFFLKKYKKKEEIDIILKGAFVILLLDGIFFASDWTPTFWIVVGIMLCRADRGRTYIVLRETGLRYTAEFNKNVLGGHQ